MRLLIGTSGLGGTQWKGVFYPKELEEDDMLGYYALRLRTLELANGSSRLPAGDVVQRWSSMTPTDFVFTLKASRSVTAELDEASSRVGDLCSRAQLLGHKLGPMLLAFPANPTRDPDQLDAFLGALPAGARVALDLRSRSWIDDRVTEILERHGVAVCVTDHEDPDRALPMMSTARFGYVRLVRASYSDDALESWAEQIVAQDWDDAFVFFTHHEAGAAPKLALRMLEHAEAIAPLGTSASRGVATPSPQLKPLAKIGPAEPAHGTEGTPRRHAKPVARTRSRSRIRKSRGWRGGAPR